MRKRRPGWQAPQMTGGKKLVLEGDKKKGPPIEKWEQAPPRKKKLRPKCLGGGGGDYRSL